MKIVWIRFFCFFSFIAVLFSGCDMFNVEVVNYLKNYTETAAIEKDELVLTSGTANNGLRCVDSNGDRFVTLILRNPQGFVLKSEDQGIEINEALKRAGYTPASVPAPFIQQLSEKSFRFNSRIIKAIIGKSR